MVRWLCPTSSASHSALKAALGSGGIPPAWGGVEWMVGEGGVDGGGGWWTGNREPNARGVGTQKEKKKIVTQFVSLLLRPSAVRQVIG